MAKTSKQVRCSFCESAFDEDLELTPLRSDVHRRRVATSSFCSRTAATASWHWPRSTLRHWRRATSSHGVRCSPIGSSTSGDKAGDRTRRSSYRPPKPPVTACDCRHRLTVESREGISVVN